MTASDTLLVGVAVLLLVPIALVPASWPVFALAAVVWLILGYGTRYVLDLEKYRRQGERQQSSSVRNWGKK
jgi:hypothetical protein